MVYKFQCSAICPTEKRTVAEWSDAERVLSPESCPEPGPWKTSRIPFLRAIMESFTIHPRTVVMKSSQVGATECVGNILGYIVDDDPGPTLIVQPTIDMGKAWSKDRLTPMLRDTPALEGKITDKAKDSDSTILHKVFSRGHVTVAGANSAASLASRPIRNLLLDEVDRYPASAGAEGDPVALAVKRTTAFRNRRIFIASTPTVRGKSRVEALFAESDQQYFHVPCPDCGEFQRLVWSQLRWKKTDTAGRSMLAHGQRQRDGRRDRSEHHPETAIYVCEHCGVEINHRKKAGMLERGEWRPTAAYNGTAGFHVSELYSPFTTWPELAANWLEAKKLPDTLKTFINTALAETWEEDADKFEPDEISARAEPYVKGPAEVLVVTASVDVQDDRLELEVCGWGDMFESWSLVYRQFLGDPAFPDVWNELDEFWRKPVELADGRELSISCMTVDSGHHTDAVYRFCKKRFRRRVYAIKGVGGLGIGVPIVGRVSRNNKPRCPMLPINVDQCKDRIFEWLDLTERGPGYMHFPTSYDDEYFYQLTAEQRVDRIVGGQRVRAYKQTRARNEALDLKAYNIAAIMILRPVWATLQARAAADVEREETPAEARPEKGQRRRGRKRSNFTTDW